MNSMDNLIQDLVKKYGNINKVSKVVSDYIASNESSLEVDESTLWIISNITRESLKVNYYVNNINTKYKDECPYILELIRKLKSIDIVMDNGFIKMVEIYKDHDFVEGLFVNVQRIKIEQELFNEINKCEEALINESITDANNLFDNYKYYVDNFYSDEKRSIDKIKDILINNTSNIKVDEKEDKINALFLPTLKKYEIKYLRIAIINLILSNNTIYFTSEGQSRKKIVEVGRINILKEMFKIYMSLNREDYVTLLLKISFENKILPTTLNSILANKKIITDFVNYYTEYIYVNNFPYDTVNEDLNKEIDRYFDELSKNYK